MTMFVLQTAKNDISYLAILSHNAEATITNETFIEANDMGMI